MAFSYTGGNTSNGFSGTPAITHGQTINAGDLVVAYVHINSSSGTITPVAGGAPWTEAINEIPSGETARHAVFWKIAGGAEPASYSWTTPLGLFRIIIKVFSSAEDAIIDAAATSSITAGASVDMVCDAIDGAVISDNAVSIIFGGKDERTSGDWATVDSSYTGVLGSSTSQDSAAAHRIYTTGTTFSGSVTFTDHGASTSALTYSVHLSFVEGDPPDVTAPTLSSPTGTETGAHTADGSVSTDEGNGTLYYYASTNSSETAATIKANGDSQAVSATGVQNVSFTALAASTTYYAHYVHDDAAANESNVVSSAGFTTQVQLFSVDAISAGPWYEGDTVTITVSNANPTGKTLSIPAGSLTVLSQDATSISFIVPDPKALGDQTSFYNTNIAITVTDGLDFDSINFQFNVPAGHEYEAVTATTGYDTIPVPGIAIGDNAYGFWVIGDGIADLTDGTITATNGTFRLWWQDTSGGNVWSSQQDVIFGAVSVISAPRVFQYLDNVVVGFVDTDTLGGNLSCWITTNATETGPDILANGHMTGVGKLSQNKILINGTAAGTYYAHFVHTIGGYSNIVSSAQFTITQKAQPTIIAEWLLEEAASGTTPTTVADAAGNGNTLTIDYSGGDAQWTEIQTGRGLEFTAAADTLDVAKVSAQNVAYGGNVFSQLSGANKVFVYGVFETTDTNTTVGSKVVYVGTDGGFGDFALTMSGTSIGINWNRETGGDAAQHFAALSPENKGLVSVVAVIDTTQIVQTDRIKFWINGEQYPSNISGIGAVTLNDTLIDTDVTDRYLVLGNNQDGDQGFLGSLYAAGLGVGDISEEQAASLSLDMLSNNSNSWTRTTTVTTDSLVTTDTTPVITGTCTHDNEDILSVVDDGNGAVDVYRTKSLSGKWETPTDPLEIEPYIFAASGPGSDFYVLDATATRMANGGILVHYRRSQSHLNNDGRVCGKISYDEGKTFGPEIEIYSHPTLDVRGTCGFVHPTTGEIWLSAPLTDADVLQKDGRRDHILLKGSPDGLTWSFEKNWDIVFPNIRTNAYGYQIYVVFQDSLTFQGNIFQYCYGRDEAYTAMWNDALEKWSSPQVVFDFGNDVNEDTMGEQAWMKIDETRCLVIIRDDKATYENTYAFLKGTVDAGGTWTWEPFARDDNSALWWDTAVFRSGTVSGTVVGDDVHLIWAARDPVEKLFYGRVNKELLWDNPRLIFSIDHTIAGKRATAYDAKTTPDAVSRVDFGNPYLIPARDVEGEVGYTTICTFNDRTADGDHDANGWILTTPRLEDI